MKLYLLLYSIFASVCLTAQKPNVILIVADDLGYGDLGCYGQKIIATPNIDRLAASGMLFTQFYAGASVCAPSRAALMTGKHTGHTAIRGNYEIQPEGQFPLTTNDVSLAQIFKQAGYVTAAFGKWGLGYPGSGGEPLKQGFGRFYGYNCQRQSHNYFPDHLYDDTSRVALDNAAQLQRKYAPDLIQNETLQFFDAVGKQPFFLYLAYTLPHAALQLPAQDSAFLSYKSLLKEQPVDVSAEWDGKGYQPQAYPRSAYAAMVTRLDAYVGEVLAKIKSLGIENNTMILFTSDNGPHREGGYDPAYFNSSGGLRGWKRDLYEGGIKVPLIVSWPGEIKTNLQSAFICAAWDLLPTLSALVSQAPPKYIDGVSLLPSLLSKGRQEKHRYLYWEFHELGGRQAVRAGNWKAVRYNVGDSTSRTELFNLRNDPFEKHDVSSRHTNLVKKMNGLIRNAHQPNSEFPLRIVEEGK